VLPFAISSFDMQKKKQKSKDYEIITSNINGTGTALELKFTIGKAHNHPTLAVWLETIDGEYIQTLFVTKSLAIGIYGHGAQNDGVWKRESGEARRPATLPYYLHKRGVKAPDGTYLPTPEHPIPDAYTGATPINSFQLNTNSDKPIQGKFNVLVEVNQPWDWNSYWNNTLYINDVDYKTSCQPALVYAVTIDLDNPMEYYVLNPIGHSHYAGKDGLLYTDITTLTTALQIFDKIEIKPIGIN
jgi:hypothetical protein